MLFDTHSHIYFDSLAHREDEIIETMRSFHMAGSVQIGCNQESNQRALELGRKYPNFLYASVGYHPTDIQDYEEKERRKLLEDLEISIQKNREIIVAIGETGLDYFHLTKGNEEPQKKRQYEWFGSQAELAKKYHLPLVIHTRNAPKETIAAIKDFNITHAVIHCFSEDISFAQALMEGSDTIYFSFSGILTYPSAKNIQQAAQEIPLDRILIETDAPFLSPVPKRSQINEPSHVRFVFEKLVELRNEDRGVIEENLLKNTRRFYRLAG